MYLLNCAVNDKVPEGLPAEVDFEELYKISKFHSVTAMVSYGLDQGGYLKTEYMSSEMIRKWASARVTAIRKNLMFDAEREAIFKHLEEIGCWYMPLKGVLLKELYPDVGMREMCDNDILFDSSFRKDLKEYMVSRGYEAEIYGNYIHDSYIKPPFYNFELHTALFSDSSRNNWFEYYEKMKNSLCKDEQNRFGYHFSEEDFYVYLMAHAYKHYKSSGTGIRSFADIYVYLKNKGNAMDWDYIAKETSHIQVENFEKDARKFSERLFCEKNTFHDVRPKDKKEGEMLTYILGSGTYGTLSNQVRNDLSGTGEGEDLQFRTKLKYCFRRVFPGMDYMRKQCPFLCKNRLLIPFYWIYRLAVFPIAHRKKIWAEIKILMRL